MSSRYRFSNQGRTRAQFLEHLKFYEGFSRQVRENRFGQAQSRQVEKAFLGVPRSFSRAYSLCGMADND